MVEKIASNWPVRVWRCRPVVSMLDPTLCRSPPAYQVMEEVLQALLCHTLFVFTAPYPTMVHRAVQAGAGCAVPSNISPGGDTVMGRIEPFVPGIGALSSPPRPPCHHSLAPRCPLSCLWPIPLPLPFPDHFLLGARGPVLAQVKPRACHLLSMTP